LWRLSGCRGLRIRQWMALLARGLNIIEPVSSPTYTIIQEYPLADDGWLFHLDLYRIDTPQAALAFGVDEYLESTEAYTIIEWPERIGSLLPAHTIHINIEHDGEGSRIISSGEL